jgi:hypothetical protein
VKRGVKITAPLGKQGICAYPSKPMKTFFKKEKKSLDKGELKWYTVQAVCGSGGRRTLKIKQRWKKEPEIFLVREVLLHSNYGSRQKPAEGKDTSVSKRAIKR